MKNGFLHIANLVKTYPGTTAPSVDHVSLNLEQGHMLALLGPSGCGKTTTLRMLAGLIEPTAGSIAVAGKDITRLPVHKRGLGMVFQSYALFPHLTVAGNVAFGLEMRGVDRSEIRKRVGEALEMVQLNALSARRITQLSGGQQQRIALARALVVKPSVLLLDEPLSNLDAKLRDAMRIEIRDIQKRYGITAVFVTHDQDEALSMADTVAVMSKGKVEQVGAPEDIYCRPVSRFAAEFIGRANFLQGRTISLNGDRFLDVPGMGRFPMRGPQAEGPVTVMIRPHRVAICPIPDMQSSVNDCRATGRVLQRSYTGELINYTLQVGEHSVSAEVLSGSAHDPAPGEVVGINWASSDLVVMSDI